MTDPNYPKFNFREFSVVDRGQNVMHITPPKLVLLAVIFSGPTAVMTSYRMVSFYSLLLGTRSEWNVGENSCCYFAGMIRIAPDGVIWVMLTMLSPFSRILFYTTCFFGDSFGDR